MNLYKKKYKASNKIYHRDLFIFKLSFYNDNLTR